MNNFNKSRFLAYGKWDWTLNRSMYRNAAIVILVLFLGATLLAFLWRFTMKQIGVEFYAINDLQLWGWFINIFKWSLAIMSGYLFHNMVTKKTQITELTIPASTSEKFWWHVAVNIGGTLIVCIMGLILSDMLLAILSALFLGVDYIHSLIGMLFTLNAESIFSSMSTYSSYEAEGLDAATNSGDLFFGSLTDFFNNIIYSIPLFAIGEGIFYTGLFSFVNSKKYKYNIPVTIIILIILGFAIGLLFILAVVLCTMYLSNNPDALSIFNQDTPPAEIFNYIFGSVIGLYIIELLVGLWLWYGTYKGYKKAQLLKTVH